MSGCGADALFPPAPARLAFFQGPRAGPNAELVRPSAGTPPPLPPVRRSPALGAGQPIRQHSIGVVGVENGEICQGGTDPYGPCRSSSNDQEAPPGIGRSIRPGVPCPETVLVAVMSDGSYLLVGYPQGEPAAFMAGEDADLLRQELERVFRNPKDDGEVLTDKEIALPAHTVELDWKP